MNKKDKIIISPGEKVTFGTFGRGEVEPLLEVEPLRESGDGTILGEALTFVLSMVKQILLHPPTDGFNPFGDDYLKIAKLITTKNTNNSTNWLK